MDKMEQKRIGLALILAFVFLSALLLLMKPFGFPVAMCLVCNCLVCFCLLVWSSLVPVSETRKKAVSAILWYWLFWYALFSTVEGLLT